ncbi:MAG: TonB-dependent receptor [bacterium]|nr:TonB-dependent receptor [bacterium]
MKRQLLLLSLAITIANISLPAYSIQEEIKLDENSYTLFGNVKETEIYSMSNYAEDIKTAGANVDIITRKDIQKQNSPELIDILQQQGSINTVTTNGSDGATTSVRMRGTDRVRFTIDGVRADRPSLTSSGFEPQFYNSDDIERVEIIRGPQGNVAGVNASGGLVSLQTRRGKGPFSLEFSSDFGNYGSFKDRIAIMSGNEKLDYYLGFTFYKTDGGLWLSDLGRVEHDAYKNFNVVSNVGYRVLNNKADIRNIFRVSNSFKDIGLNYDGLTGDTYLAPNGNYLRNLDLMEVLSFEHQPTEKYSYNAKFGLYHNRTNSYVLPDTINSDPYSQSTSEITSSRINFITQHNYKLFDWNTVSLGYNLESEFINAFSSSTATGWLSPETFEDEYQGSTIQHDIFLNDSINIKDKLFIRGGARLISNSQYGTYVTPNVSAALVLPTFKIKDATTKFRGSWGQSVNMPTLYQRYGTLTSAWGTTLPNPDLEAEKFSGWDAGIEQSFFNDKLSFDFGYFNNKYSDYIAYEYAYPYSYYKNISNANIHGYEAKLTWTPNKKIKLVLNYTYTKSEDETTEEALPACPENMVSGTLYWTPIERLNLFVGVDGVSNQALSSSVYSEHTAGYVNARIGGNLKVLSYKGVEVFIRGTIQNLFNQNICMYKTGNSYYYAPGIRFMAGLFVKYTFDKKETSL